VRVCVCVRERERERDACRHDFKWDKKEIMV
jgi:hypothetical protein